MTPSVVVPDSDEELLRSLGVGAHDAVALLYQRYGAKMLAFARRYADGAAAEDIVVDLLRRWLERPPNVRDAERLTAFLATSIYHASIDWIRRERAQQGQPPREQPPALPSPHLEFGEGQRGGPPVDHQVLASHLARALEQLSDADRLLLESHYGQALTAEECMAQLGINRAAFHQRLHRARTRLATLLAQDATAGLEGKSYE